MKIETTTKVTERAVTTYICEEEGCDFSTTNKNQAEKHTWKNHKKFEEVYFDLDPNEEVRTDINLVKFNSEEDFEAYKKYCQYSDLNAKEPWEGPGWYETWTKYVPCPRGCCSDLQAYIQPAAETLYNLKKTQERLGAAIKKIEETSEAMKELGISDE